MTKTGRPRRRMNRSDWDDDAALLVAIDPILRALDSEAALTGLFPSDRPDILLGLLGNRPSFEEAAEAAIEAVEKRNDWRPLLEVLESALFAELPPRAQALIRDRVLHGTGVSRAPGRPPMSEAERRQRTPTHDRADEARTIEAILKERFPDKSRVAIRQKAVALTLQRAGDVTDESRETLLEHMAHPRKHLRRP